MISYRFAGGLVVSRGRLVDGADFFRFWALFSFSWTFWRASTVVRLSPYGRSKRCLRLSVTAATDGVKKPLMTFVRTSRDLWLVSGVGCWVRVEEAVGVRCGTSGVRNVCWPDGSKLDGGRSTSNATTKVNMVENSRAKYLLSWSVGCWWITWWTCSRIEEADARSERVLRNWITECVCLVSRSVSGCVVVAVDVVSHGSSNDKRIGASKTKV